MDHFIAEDDEEFEPELNSASGMNMPIAISCDKRHKMTCRPSGSPDMKQLVGMTPNIERPRTESLRKSPNKDTNSEKKAKSFCQEPLRTNLKTSLIPAQGANSMEDWKHG